MDVSRFLPDRLQGLIGRKPTAVLIWREQIATLRCVALFDVLYWRWRWILKMLQFLHHNSIHFAEVKFYFTRLFGDEMRAFALVSPYSPPNEYLVQVSHNTLITCMYQGEE